jgi:CheY-like chemotaxis protein
MEKTTEAGKRESAPTRKKRILVVDDSSDLLNLNRTLLESEDYEVFTALSGKEALDVLAKILPLDLILLDMRMEDMSGPEFLLVLEKELPAILEDVPVVFHSALDKIPVSKATGSITKPVDMDKFLEAVHHFIEMGAGRLQLKH